MQAHYFPISTPYTDLEDISWQIIHNVAVTNPHPETCFAIGATKHVQVNNYSHLVKIIGFNHDQLSTSTSAHRQYAGVTFEFFNFITDDSQYGFAGTYWHRGTSLDDNKNYSYSTSTIRNFLNEGENSILNKLPDDLKDEGIIKKVYKPVAETSSYTINNSYSDKLFPLSCYELTGTSRVSAKDEGFQYEYWKSHNTSSDRIKKHAEDKSGASAQLYWLRSPDTHDYTFAWMIERTGNFNNKVGAISITPLPVAPAFCI